MISDWMEANIQLPSDAHEFAIGDVHGMLNLFKPMLEEMGRESNGTGHLTQLGDINDRGPDTLGCYRAFFGPTPQDMGFAGRTGLVGNHEGFMLACFLPDQKANRGAAYDTWIPNGGKAVLKELHAKGVPYPPQLIGGLLHDALGDAVFNQLCAVESHRHVGNLLFVHAGIQPGAPLDKWFAKPRCYFWGEDHYTWIRNPFFEHDDQYDGDLLVVHGHTYEHWIRKWKGSPTPEGHFEIDGWRLGLDGGTYNSGILAGAEFKNGAYRIYTQHA